MFYVLLMYALFASVFTIAKTGLFYSQPLFFLGSRMFLAGIILLGYQFIVQKQSFSLNFSKMGKLVLLATVNIYLTNIFELWGLKYLSSSKTCFIYSLSPFLSALMAYLVFNEKMKGKKWIGLIIGFLGMIPIFLYESANEQASGYFVLSIAEISVILAVICSMYGWILLQQLVRDQGCDATMANGMSMLLGGAFALIHSSLAENWNPIPVTEFLPFLYCSLLLVIISNLICYNLYGNLLKKYSATFLSFAGFVTPLFTALFGWIYLGEKVTWPFFLSAGLVLCGLYLFFQEELQRDRVRTGQVVFES